MQSAPHPALLVVDVQRDFCTGGALAAYDTDALLPALATFIAQCRTRGILVVFTQDWHPANHRSFSVNGGTWPRHCVAGSAGAEVMPELRMQAEDWIVRKGTDAKREGYSAFDRTNLAARLYAANIGNVGVCGIATEYCVRASTLDAVRAGFRVSVLLDLTRPVDATIMPSIAIEFANAGIATLPPADWFTSLQVVN